MGGDRISLSRFAERIVELLLLCEVQSEDGVQIVRDALEFSSLYRTPTFP